nr:hypothetical protein [Acidobacteriota bacterium]
MKNCRKFSHLAPALLVCFAATPLLAATHVWTGEVSNRFSEGANWRGGSPAGDPLAELVFPEAVRQSIVNDLAALTVQSMKFETDGYELRGNTIDVAEGTELELRENTLACALRFEGKIVEAPLRGHATFARTSRQAVAASSEPATNAQSTVFQFTPTTVAARVTRSAETVWLAIVRHSNFYQRLAARRGDTDGDGIVEWDLPVSEVGLTNSKWCVIDLAARKVHAANRDGSEVEVQPMSVRFLRDASGAYSVADVNWGTDPLNTSDLLWVRPGVGAWRRSSTLLGQATINGQLRRLEALSRFAPLEGSPEAPAGVQRGDFLVAMTMGNFGEGVVFGGLVDAALGATSTNPAELFWFSGGTQEGRPTLSLLRFGSAERAITLSYSVTAGTAVAGVHFQPTAGNVTIEPGEILSSFPLAIIDDDVYSGRQTVRVELSNVSGATVFPATSATTGIADNDPAPVVSAGNTSVAEGGDGPHTVPVKLTLTGKTRVPAEVSWRAYFENATPPQMFETVVFAPGETEKTVGVPVVADSADEAEELFRLTLSNSSDPESVGSPGVATVGINDSDTPILIAFDEQRVKEGDE